MIVIEGTLFAIALVTYFYLRGLAQSWPLSAPPPALLWGTLNAVLLAVSGMPNHLAAKASLREDLRAVRLWMVVCVVIAAAVQVGATAEVRGAQAVAETFSGRARVARVALLDGAPGAVWAPGGKPRIAFEFTIEGDRVTAIELVADPERLAQMEVVVESAPDASAETSRVEPGEAD